MRRDPNLRGVLLIDDEPEAREILQHLCAQAKLPNPLRVFSNGEEAVDYLKRLRATGAEPIPCLAIVDIKMPGMSGHDVLAWIRAQTAFADLSVVMLSTGDEAAEVRRAKELGAHAYLLKFPSAETLAGLVRVAQSSK